MAAALLPRYELRSDANVANVSRAHLSAQIESRVAVLCQINPDNFSQHIDQISKT